MVTPDQVTGVIVTRGNVDLTEILESLPFNTITWDNSIGKDLSVYGRYEACRDVMTPLVYFQDDDCVVEDPMAIVAAHEPGHVVCNMPAEFRHDFYAEHALIGFGAVCEPWRPGKAFERIFPDLMNPAPEDEWWNYRMGDLRVGDSSAFHRDCDIVFTALTPRILVDVPVRNLPWATGADRLYRQPEHGTERAKMLELALAVRDA